MEVVKRLSAIIIFLCLLVTALFGCAGTDDEAQPAAQSAAVSDEAPAGPLDHIETRDLGIVLNVLVEGDHMNRYASVEIMPSETNSDLLNENIEERNNLVEEKLGVTLNEIRTDATNNMQTLIRNDNISGTKLYDIVMPYFNDAAMLAPEGMFLNLYDYSDYIRFDAPYWDQRCIEDVSIAGKLYFATGDISLLTFDCTHCLIFNKNLLAESGITEDPYQLVLDGEWTIDKLHEMARAATSDSDGETGMTYEDTWGFFVNLNYATSLFVGSGERLSQKDEDDMPIITVNTERAITVMDKIVELYGDQASTIQIESFATEATGNGTDCWAEATRAVAEGRALFRSMAIVDLHELDDYEDVNYGILPTPKFTADQEEYHCNVSTVYASSIAIPSQTPNNPEDIAIALEALAAASSVTVRDAYYNNILKTRSLQDDESEKMLDIMFENRVYDLGAIYGWGQTTGIYDPDSLTNFLNYIATSGQNTFASKWQSIQSKVEQGLKETLEQYEKLN